MVKANSLDTQRGIDNTFIGSNSGNFTLSGIRNLGYGSNVLQSVTTGGSNNYNVGQFITTGSSNAAFGTVALSSLSIGTENIAVGPSALNGLLTGSFNIGIGGAAGDNYTGAESSNIIIGQVDGTTGENNTIRIGQQGTNPGEQNKCFLAGDLNTVSGRVVAVTPVTGATYTTFITDYVLACNRAGTIAITLIASPATGRTYRIKDISGAAAANNITITPAAGNIDAGANYVINTNYGSVDLVYTGAAWSLL